MVLQRPELQPASRWEETRTQSGFFGFSGSVGFDQTHGAKGGENWTCSVGVTQLDGSLRTSSLAGAQEGAKEPGVSIFRIEQEDSTWSDRSSPTFTNHSRPCRGRVADAHARIEA